MFIDINIDNLLHWAAQRENTDSNPESRHFVQG